MESICHGKDNISNLPVAMAATSIDERLTLWIASAKSTVWGRTLRAALVDNEKSGIATTTRRSESQSNWIEWTCPPCIIDMTKPPSSDAATLSGCPSNSVAKSSNSVREKGASHRTFAVNSPPSMAVPLPPSPRIAGTPFVRTNRSPFGLYPHLSNTKFAAR